MLKLRMLHYQIQSQAHLALPLRSSTTLPSQHNLSAQSHGALDLQLHLYLASIPKGLHPCRCLQAHPGMLRLGRVRLNTIDRSPLLFPATRSR